ncbi:MAG: trigger factor [Anaerolineae bacterium]|nr:trigger factor [Anaerolineae bacterium]NUQ05054.1 trigger factor [Anaerolineae bacterium]
MNVTTELQSDHTARLTVAIDNATFDDARQKAARSLSKKVNIPGFRKGKAPLRILVNYLGEASIIEEAVEMLSQDMYREALIASGVLPYGPGALIDIKAETMPPVLVYTVPLEPTVDLGDYRDLRLDYEPPTVNDEQVDRSMRALQEEYAVTEESHRPAEMGDRLNLALHSFFVDDQAQGEADGEAHDPEGDDPEDREQSDHDHADHEHEDDAIHQHMSADQEVYIHEHDTDFTLDTSDDLAPGFSEAMVGVRPSETREFTLEFADDESEEDEELRGRKVHFIVTTNKVETQTLPALNDELAARVTKDEENPLTLLELRVRVRENLQRSVLDRYKSEYARRALDGLLERAALAYPEAMVADHVDMLLQDFDQRLRRSGITLQDYLKINHKTDEELRDDWRDSGVNSVKRTLVLQALVRAERLTVAEAAIDAELQRFVEQFGEESRESLRAALSADRSMRDNIRGNLMQDVVFERLADIARGEAPPLPEPIVAQMEDAPEHPEVVESQAEPEITGDLEPAPSDQNETSENEETAT